MRYIAILYTKETGFSIFETKMRTVEDITESAKNGSHTCLWGKILTEEDGVIVAEWQAHTRPMMGALNTENLARA